MKLKLSSNSTLFMRNKFPYVWVAGPVLMTLILLVSGNPEAWSVLLFTVFGGLFAFWISRLLYEICIDGNYLYISN